MTSVGLRQRITTLLGVKFFPTLKAAFKSAYGLDIEADFDASLKKFTFKRVDRLDFTPEHSAFILAYETAFGVAGRLVKDA